MRDAIRARAVLGVLLLISVTLILVDVRGGGAVSSLRTLVAAVVGPVERAAGAVASPVIGLVRGADEFGDAATRSSLARQELGKVASGDGGAQSGAGQLESLLKTAGVGGYEVLPARVVGYDTSAGGFAGAVTIDAGSADGIEADMSVMNGDGLVGKVVSVGPATATVQLISDGGSVVGARMETTLEAGALEGLGEPGRLGLRLLDPSAPVEVGSRLVTMGSPGGRPYAAGLPLGTVAGFRGEPGQADRLIFVDPAAKLTALDLVAVVVVPPRRDPRDSVLPPRPAPAASASASAGASDSGAAGTDAPASAVPVPSGPR